MIIKLGPSNSRKKNNLWLHLASWNLTDFLVCLESKTEPSAAKAQNYMGGIPYRKICTGKRGHRTYLLDEWNKWGGDTAQHLQKKLSCGWVEGGFISGNP